LPGAIGHHATPSLNSGTKEEPPVDWLVRIMRDGEPNVNANLDDFSLARHIVPSMDGRRATTAVMARIRGRRVNIGPLQCGRVRKFGFESSSRHAIATM
jgi:hypothetical protein